MLTLLPPVAAVIRSTVIKTTTFDIFLFLAGPASAEAAEGHPSATTTEGELTASALLRWLMEGTFTSPYLRILLGEENTVFL